MPKNVIQSHEYLKIKKGEVGRWVVLFKSVLQKYEQENLGFVTKWAQEIDKFEKIFLNAQNLY